MQRSTRDIALSVIRLGRSSIFGKFGRSLMAESQEARRIAERESFWKNRGLGEAKAGYESARVALDRQDSATAEATQETVVREDRDDL
jgi:hypothetical protein